MTPVGVFLHLVTCVYINLVVMGTSGCHWNFAIRGVLGDLSYLLDYILWSISRISIEYNTRYIMLLRVEMDMLTMTRHILDMSPATHPPVSNWSVIDSCWQVAVHVWLVLDINHCFRKCLAACLAPRYLLSQCWEINYWTRWVIFQ